MGPHRRRDANSLAGKRQSGGGERINPSLFHCNIQRLWLSLPDLQPQGDPILFRHSWGSNLSVTGCLWGNDWLLHSETKLVEGRAGAWGSLTKDS